MAPTGWSKDRHLRIVISRGMGRIAACLYIQVASLNFPGKGIGKGIAGLPT
jgi:hypothetical protein